MTGAVAKLTGNLRVVCSWSGLDSASKSDDRTSFWGLVRGFSILITLRKDSTPCRTDAGRGMGRLKGKTTTTSKKHQMHAQIMHLHSVRGASKHTGENEHN